MTDTVMITLTYDLHLSNQLLTELAKSIVAAQAHQTKRVYIADIARRSIIYGLPASTAPRFSTPRYISLIKQAVYLFKSVATYCQ